MKYHNGFDCALYQLGGVLYQFHGWLGCQLRSYEPRKLPLGTKREIAGYELVVFSTKRHWLRVETTWALPVTKGIGLDDHNALIENLREAVYSACSIPRTYPARPLAVPAPPPVEAKTTEPGHPIDFD